MEAKEKLIKLIKNTEVFCPKPAGKKDILIASDKIAMISDSINLNIDSEIIDGRSKIAVPGFIDNHVHIIGGGGEGGYVNRTPEIKLTDLTNAGVTTVIGCLGTDGYSRSMKELLAKAYALEAEGISTFVYTGNYRVPLLTVTKNIPEDLILIKKIIGAGEVAISDHRSSQPTFDELKRLIADTRIGGILSGKAGVVNFHIGDSDQRLDILNRIVAETELPITQMLPTHIGRSPELISAAMDFAKRGGMVDLTTSVGKELEKGKTVQTDKVFKYFLANGVPPENISFSSDGQGSLPVFDKDGKFLYLGIGKVKSLFDQFRKSVTDESIELETALKPVTLNPARYLKLEGKGSISEAMDADLLLLDKNDLSLDTVIAKGKIMIREEEVLVKGRFENR